MLACVFLENVEHWECETAGLQEVLHRDYDRCLGLLNISCDIAYVVGEFGIMLWTLFSIYINRYRTAPFGWGLFATAHAGAHS